MVNSKVLINVFLGIFLASILLLMICSQSQVTAREPAETFIDNTMKEIHIHAAGDGVTCGVSEYCCEEINGVCTECCRHRNIVDFANKICCQDLPGDEITCESGYGHKTRNPNSSCCKWDISGRYCK
ncbi:hypothetical protein OROMI_002418 [Orobanche minor]